MTEQEAKALAAEFAHHKTWRPIGVHLSRFHGLPEQWGVMLSHRTLVSVLYVDNPDANALHRDLAWCEENDGQAEKHAYIVLRDGTHRLIRGSVKMTFANSPSSGSHSSL